MATVWLPRHAGASLLTTAPIEPCKATLDRTNLDFLAGYPVRNVAAVPLIRGFLESNPRRIILWESPPPSAAAGSDCLAVMRDNVARLCAGSRSMTFSPY